MPPQDPNNPAVVPSVPEPITPDVAPVQPTEPIIEPTASVEPVPVSIEIVEPQADEPTPAEPETTEVVSEVAVDVAPELGVPEPTVNAPTVVDASPEPGVDVPAPIDAAQVAPVADVVVPASPTPADAPTGDVVAPIAAGAVVAAGKSKKKLILFGLVGLIIVTVIAVGAVVALKAMPVKYRAADLKTFKEGKYTAAYPKQWQDVSDQKEITKKLLGNDAANVKDVKVYAYKLNKATNTYKSVIVSADMAFPVDDATLKQVLDVPTYKTQFEKEFTDSFSKEIKNDDCKSIRKGDSKITYDTPRFAVEFNGSYECTLKDEIQKDRGVKDAHFEFVVGIKGGAGYLGALETGTDDWNRNKDFYQKNLITSLKPN